MQRTSEDRHEDSDGSSSYSDDQQSEQPSLLPRAVSAEDGALKKAALQVERDLAGLEIPEVTSAAAQSAAATAPMRSMPLAAGQLQGNNEPAEPSATEPSRLSPALLRALDAETNAQAGPGKAPPASLAVQAADSRRGTGDSVAEPLPASAYAKGSAAAPNARKHSVSEPLPASAYPTKQQPSRFASPRGVPAPAVSESGDSDSASDGYPEAAPMAVASAKSRGKAADAMGLTVSVKAASRMRTESDVSQDADNSPSSARPLMAGPSSSALAAAPGSVTVSPKGSVVGFMPFPAGQHPLESEDYDTMSVDSDPTGGRPLLRQNFMPSDDAAYREASFARSQDSMTQPPTYSRLAAQSTTGRHVQMSAPSKSRMAPQSSAGSFASVARSEASFVSSIGGSRSKEQALADTYARACARLRALEETEGELFRRKSQWSEGFHSFMEFYWRVVAFFTLWKTSIQSVEGKHGSNVSLTLYFMRFAFWLNVLMLAIWVVLAVFPFFDSPPKSFSWQLFKETSPGLMVQGYGLDDTFLVYGGYNYTVGTTHGFFRPDLLWPIAMGGMYLFSLLILLYVIQQRLQGEGDSGFVGSNKLFPFSTVVFASWDYHLTDAGAARNLRHSIRNQLKEMVNDALLEDKIEDTRTKVKAYIRKALLLIIVWPGIVVFTAAGTFFVIKYQQQIIQQLNTGFGSTICLSFINIISSQLVSFSTEFEEWHPSVRTNVEAVKLFVLKTINLATLVYQLFVIQTNANSAQKYLHLSNYNDYLSTCNPDLGTAAADAQCSKGLECCDASCALQTNTLGLQGYCVPGCAEDVIGITFYKYILTNVASINGVELLSAIGKKCLHMESLIDAPWVVIQVIENQALVWLGSMYAPLLPAFGLAANIITFYFKFFLAVWLHSPPKTRYSASRTSNLAYGLMLLTVAMTTVPLVYDLQVTRQRCGPHQGTSMKSALVDAINTQKFFNTVLTWLINPIVLGSIIVFIAFWLIIARGQLKRYFKESTKLKEEFDKYRREMQVKVLVTRKRGSRASSAAPSGDASFSSGKSFIAAQHAEEARPFAEGPLTREDRSMTHEGILLHESPQTPKSPSGLKPVKSNLKSSAPPPPAADRPNPARLPPLTDQLAPPAPPAVVQTPVSPVSNSPRGLRSISLFMPDTRTASASSNLSTEHLQQGPSSSADAPDDLSGVHARAYMAEQRRRRGTSFVDVSGKSHTFKGVPGQL
ncbi:hypothetical protein WJX77_009861 [Trebouxia sp. C0004]